MKIRVNKNHNYSIMSNVHLRDKRLSLKAKGLLSVMLSLRDDWNYSVNGLVAINKENETSINSALKELKEYGYLEVNKLLPNQTDTGRIEYIYDIYEYPKQYLEKQGVDFLGVEFLGVEFLGVENQGQLNTNVLNTDNKILNNKILKDKYIKYGNYGRVKLTEEQYKKLCDEFEKDYIDKVINALDEYIESNNNKNKYTNFNLVIRRAIRDKWFKIDTFSSHSSIEVEWGTLPELTEEDKKMFENMNKK